MMGTSLLAVAWAIYSAGLAAGILIVLLMTLLSGYTALVIIKTHGQYHSKSLFKTHVFYLWESHVGRHLV